MLQCLQFAKLAVRQCKHGCKKKKKRKGGTDRTLIRSDKTLLTQFSLFDVSGQERPL